MNVYVESVRGSIPTPERPTARGRAGQRERESRQFDRLIAISLGLFVVVAALGRLTGWRWRPWPPGRDGYGSILGEARSAAETYVGCAFTSW
ncbi:MAG: hypothetical protein QNK03_28020 [Myxococcota bacterium]|nr:hypothetical protein [Myxococcota bacterium]